MCRKGAWIELTVEVTSVEGIRSRAHGKKDKNDNEKHLRKHESKTWSILDLRFF